MIKFHSERREIEVLLFIKILARGKCISKYIPKELSQTETFFVTS